MRPILAIDAVSQHLFLLLVKILQIWLERNKIKYILFGWIIVQFKKGETTVFVLLSAQFCSAI